MIHFLRAGKTQIDVSTILEAGDRSQGKVMMNSRYAVVLAAAAALSWEPAVHAQSVTPGTTITLEGATKMVRACETFAREKGLVVSVWVIDAAGTPIYMKRMEGSILRAVDFAFWKAETAIIWEGSTDPAQHGFASRARFRIPARR